jgi:ATP-dependent protease ClpP protease subunit
MPPKRESDRLLERLRMLVHDSRRGNGASSTELERRSREIERLRAELADVVKQTAATEGEQL